MACYRVNCTFYLFHFKLHNLFIELVNLFILIPLTFSNSLLIRLIYRFESNTFQINIPFNPISNFIRIRIYLSTVFISLFSLFISLLDYFL